MTILLRWGPVSEVCLTLSDTHLSPGYGEATARDLARLVAAHPEAEVVLAGDIFDLSVDRSEVPIQESLARVVSAHPALTRALKEHAGRGAKLTLVPGNHDASLASPAGVQALKRLFEIPDDRQLEIASWFVRRGEVHIEHGHLYDPDCAPNHPLADPSPRSEGLGTALMRRFIAPNQAFSFAHAHTTTPVAGLQKAFALWGAGAPLVIARYFRTAFALCGEAVMHKPIVRLERQIGSERLARHAERVGVPRDALASLLQAVPSPTHHSFRDTFYRLYFDRIFAAVALSTGACLLASAGLGAGLPSVWRAVSTSSSTGALLSALGGGYLGYSFAQHQGRNHWTIPVDHLSRAARLVNDTTGSRLCVFGHTHVEVDEPGYLNLGSFGFSGSTRPYALVDENGRYERRSLPRSGH